MCQYERRAGQSRPPRARSCLRRGLLARGKSNRFCRRPDTYMNHANDRSGLSLRLFDPDPTLIYAIDAVERLTQLPRRSILIYCRHGLVSPLADPKIGGYYFNRDAIRALRRIGYLQV